MLDAREEVIISGLLKVAADGEAECDFIRARMCEDPEFEPYTAFKALQLKPMTSGVLTAKDITVWLTRQYYKTSLLRERDLQNLIDHYSMGEGVLRYEGFLKLVLPREDKRVRSLVMCRRSSSMLEREMGRDGGYHFIRLLEQECALYEELTLRRKRLLEYEWREDREHIAQRAFTWLQSMSSAPGVTHVSVLAVCRLLCDVKELLSINQVEQLFHRVNLSGTDMLSFAEFDKFLQSKEANAYLNELYVRNFSTMCPGCGAMVQREGGACNNVTCYYCRTTFKCNTNAQDADLLSPRAIKTISVQQNPYANDVSGGFCARSGAGSPRNVASLSPRTPRKTNNMSMMSTNVGNDTSFMSNTSSLTSPRAAATNVAGGYSTVLENENNNMFTTSYIGEDKPKSMSTYMSPPEPQSVIYAQTPKATDSFQTGELMTKRRQKINLKKVVECMCKMMDVDHLIESEKEQLWQAGVNLEAAFKFLDRYQKGYIADTDVWQVMHGSDLPCTFSGVCQLFRDLKKGDAAKLKQGQLSLAELTHVLFPKQSEEAAHVEQQMKDAEALNVLYVVRSTISCPGCGTRVQRTMEGCSSVTCSVCRTPFRCNLIGDDRDTEFRLTLTQKHKIKQYLKFAIDAAEDTERFRKMLMMDVDALSTALLDAFLLMSDDKGYISFLDFQKAILEQRNVRTKEIELLWQRFAGSQSRRLGFVDFAAQMRPFGTQ
ncbi:unnamed protein product [Amoebophrya sp. A120]|nr:unnamed protein product [Amoebophrya sp. A120]|eukprot:GSA120T00015569001.1